ncbi:hypothetical protein IWQ60_004335 [Tieghemiomyces parasiticus]|uniref:histidine kinase n=1 Tax=Tieghemiomyces parasiticus TaxID=78921 RepID=A0A9W8A921_9FUNG|nr:hypothetical protein IWQ60_004335 [Tieghemiomyces parasiticus]
MPPETPGDSARQVKVDHQLDSPVPAFLTRPCDTCHQAYASPATAAAALTPAAAYLCDVHGHIVSPAGASSTEPGASLPRPSLRSVAGDFKWAVFRQLRDHLGHTPDAETHFRRISLLAPARRIPGVPARPFDPGRWLLFSLIERPDATTRAVAAHDTPVDARWFSFEWADATANVEAQVTALLESYALHTELNVSALPTAAKDTPLPVILADCLYRIHQRAAVAIETLRPDTRCFPLAAVVRQASSSAPRYTEWHYLSFRAAPNSPTDVSSPSPLASLAPRPHASALQTYLSRPVPITDATSPVLPSSLLDPKAPAGAPAIRLPDAPLLRRLCSLGWPHSAPGTTTASLVPLDLPDPDAEPVLPETSFWLLVTHQHAVVTRGPPGDYLAAVARVVRPIINLTRRLQARQPAGYREALESLTRRLPPLGSKSPSEPAQTPLAVAIHGSPPTVERVFATECLGRLSQNIGEGVAIVDAQGTLQLTNDRFRELIGLHVDHPAIQRVIRVLKRIRQRLGLGPHPSPLLRQTRRAHTGDGGAGSPERPNAAAPAASPPIIGDGQLHREFAALTQGLSLDQLLNLYAALNPAAAPTTSTSLISSDGSPEAEHSGAESATGSARRSNIGSRSQRGPEIYRVSVEALIQQALDENQSLALNEQPIGSPAFISETTVPGATDQTSTTSPSRPLPADPRSSVAGHSPPNATGPTPSGTAAGVPHPLDELVMSPPVAIVSDPSTDRTAREELYRNTAKKIYEVVQVGYENHVKRFLTVDRVPCLPMLFPLSFPLVTDSRPVGLTVVPLGGPGPSRLVAIVLTDLTDELAAAAANTRLDQKVQFFSFLSHEMRTPLTGITGALELFQATKLDAEQQTLLELFEFSSRSLQNLLDNILEFSKLEAQRVMLDLRPHSFREVIDPFIKVATRWGHTNRVEFCTELDPRIPDGLVMDDQRLFQILSNLITNAFKFTRRDGIYTQERSIIPGMGGTNEPYRFRPGTPVEAAKDPPRQDESDRRQGDDTTGPADAEPARRDPYIDPYRFTHLSPHTEARAGQVLLRVRLLLDGDQNIHEEGPPLPKDHAFQTGRLAGWILALQHSHSQAEAHAQAQAHAARTAAAVNPPRPSPPLLRDHGLGHPLRSPGLRRGTPQPSSLARCSFGPGSSTSGSSSLSPEASPSTGGGTGCVDPAQLLPPRPAMPLNPAILQAKRRHTGLSSSGESVASPSPGTPSTPPPPPPPPSMQSSSQSASDNGRSAAVPIPAVEPFQVPTSSAAQPSRHPSVTAQHPSPQVSEAAPTTNSSAPLPPEPRLPFHSAVWTPTSHLSSQSPNLLTDSCRLLFEVVDNGIGITAENQTRLFQEYSQAERSTTRRYGGTGIGLYICKQLVELFGGQIGVESVFGEGSRFYFTAWFQKQHPAATPSAVSMASEAGGDYFREWRRHSTTTNGVGAATSQGAEESLVTSGLSGGGHGTPTAPDYQSAPGSATEGAVSSASAAVSGVPGTAVGHAPTIAEVLEALSEDPAAPVVEQYPWVDSLEDVATALPASPLPPAPSDSLDPRSVGAASPAGNDGQAAVEQDRPAMAPHASSSSSEEVTLPDLAFLRDKKIFMESLQMELGQSDRSRRRRRPSVGIATSNASSPRTASSAGANPQAWLEASSQRGQRLSTSLQTTAVTTDGGAVGDKAPMVKHHSAPRLGATMGREVRLTSAPVETTVATQEASTATTSATTAVSAPHLDPPPPSGAATKAATTTTSVVDVTNVPTSKAAPQPTVAVPGRTAPRSYEGSPGVTMAPAQAPRYTQQQVRILMAEDDNVNRAIMVRHLQNFGFVHLDVVWDGGMALESFRQSWARDEGYHFVLLDMYMPVMNGIDVAEEIHRIVSDFVEAQQQQQQGSKAISAVGGDVGGHREPADHGEKTPPGPTPSVSHVSAVASATAGSTGTAESSPANTTATVVNALPPPAAAKRVFPRIIGITADVDARMSKRHQAVLSSLLIKPFGKRALKAEFERYIDFS